MWDDVYYSLGFFVPILLAGVAGFLFGRRYERRKTGLTKPAPAQQSPDQMIMGVVTAIIPEYHHAKVLTPERRQYSIGRKTQGIDWATLQVGERVKIRVEDGIVTYAVRS